MFSLNKNNECKCLTNKSTTWFQSHCPVTVINYNLNNKYVLNVIDVTMQPCDYC